MRCMLHLTGEKITQALLAYQESQPAHPYRMGVDSTARSYRASAVIMPLLIHEGQWHLLFTQRSNQLQEHSGQVSFPGGSWEEDDPDLQATALREMEEEIGVAPQDVQVLGALGEMPILTGYLVRVYVGQIPWPYFLQLNGDEVESTFIVPLKWLKDPAHRTERFRSIAGREFPVIYFDLFEEHLLWGASAEMTVRLLDALGKI